MSDITQNGALKRDDNDSPVMGGTSSSDNATIINAAFNPVTRRLLTDSGGGGSGTVTDVSVVSANGFAGTVATSTTTPAITLTTTITGILKGNGTAISAAVAGTDYADLTFKTISVSGQSDVVADTAADTLTLVAGSGMTITTNATTDTITFAASGGAATSITVGTTTVDSGTTTRILYDNAGVLGEYTITGSGTVVAMATAPTFVTSITTPSVLATANDSGALGASGTAFADLFLASGGVINWAVGDYTLTHSVGILTANKDLRITTVGTDSASVVTVGGSQSLVSKTYNGLTITTTTGTLTMTNAKTLAVTNTLTLSGTDSTVMTFPTTSKTIAANDGSNWTIASQAIGDILTATSTTAYGRLAAVATGSVLASAGTGTAPAWSSAPQITTIELGNASDTTLSRSAAGVLAVEGVVIPSISSTNTLTNKRVTRRLTTTNAPGATPTTNTDNVDVMNFTGLNTAITSMTTNLSGTPSDGDLLEFRFLDDGTARAITWGATFASTTVTMPTTTVISTCLRVGFEWRAASSKWECIATC